MSKNKINPEISKELEKISELIQEEENRFIKEFASFLKKKPLHRIITKEEFIEQLNEIYDKNEKNEKNESEVLKILKEYVNFFSKTKKQKRKKKKDNELINQEESVHSDNVGY